MAKIAIDDRTLEFEAGETIIEVAARNDIEIPHYCWHPRLSVAANCRMCLVEVEKAPKLLPACQTECRDEMVVRTSNEKVEGAQRAVHEFLLINHPIDCPICDQAGECKLQDYYMKYQLAPSRMADAKVHKPRLEPLGPHVMYNAERCILCTRCVRFMEEVAKDRQLGVINRGDHSEIGVFNGQPLDSPYSLNTVDVCPVGALTSRAFRFRQRVWNLRRRPSLCGGCARGCNVHVDARSGQVYRLLPRENDDVNQSWLCDEGRLTYNRANQDRLTTAWVDVAPEDGGSVAAAEVDQALYRTEQLLRPIADAGQGLVGALSLHATCEEAFVFARLLRDVFGADTVAVLGYEDGDADDLLRVADKNPNRAGITRVLGDMGFVMTDGPGLEAKISDGTAKAVLMLGHEVANRDALAAKLAEIEVFIHVAPTHTALVEAAQVTLPGAAWVEVDGTWVNVDGRAQRLYPAHSPRGTGRTHLEWLREIASRLGTDLALPSAQTVRVEMERALDGFKGASLSDLGPMGGSL